MGASEGGNESCGGSNEWSTSRNDQKTTEGSRNDVVVTTFGQEGREMRARKVTGAAASRANRAYRGITRKRLKARVATPSFCRYDDRSGESESGNASNELSTLWNKIKAGVNMNLSERERLTDSCPTPQWHPRLLGNCLVCIYQLLNSNSNSKTTPNFKNFLFP